MLVASHAHVCQGTGNWWDHKPPVKVKTLQDGVVVVVAAVAVLLFLFVCGTIVVAVLLICCCCCCSCLFVELFL